MDMELNHDNQYNHLSEYHVKENMILWWDARHAYCFVAVNPRR